MKYLDAKACCFEKPEAELLEMRRVRHQLAQIVKSIGEVFCNSVEALP